MTGDAEQIVHTTILHARDCRRAAAVLRFLDQLGDADAEVLLDRDDLTVRDEPVVHQHGHAGQAELDYRGVMFAAALVKLLADPADLVVNRVGDAPKGQIRAMFRPRYTNRT